MPLSPKGHAAHLAQGFPTGALAVKASVFQNKFGTLSANKINKAGSSHKKPSKLPPFLKPLLATVLALAAIYVAGGFFFSHFFMPNTSIQGRNVSLKSISEVAGSLSDRTDAYVLKVSGNGLDFSIPGNEIDLSFDASSYVKSAIQETHPWGWPFEVFIPHAIDHARGSSYGVDKVAALVNEACEAHNKDAKDPVNATIAFDKGSSMFAVVAEQAGTKVDTDKVLQQVNDALSTLETSVELGDDVLVQASITQDDESLAQAAEAANGFLSAKITLDLDGKNAGTIDSSKIIDWVTLNDSLEATLDADAVTAWGRDVLSKELDTVGSERSYTRPDGKQVTVVGGTYGWNVDSKSLATLITEAVVAGETTTIKVPTYQTAQILPGDGGRDWGNSYVDVDLSEQHVRYYDDSGNLVWETDCVSGDAAKNYQTPTGVYFINSNFNKSAPASVLRGKIDPETKKPEYETPVAYWMPFVGNSVGLHDADWRSKFGSNIYEYNGSHGCVNLPPDKAAELAGLINVGTVVVVHN